MDSYEHGVLGSQITHHHCQVHIAVDDVFKSDRAKAPVDGGQVSLDHPAHQHFFLDPIPDEVSHGDHLQVMLRGKHLELRQTGHRPVFVHHLANDPGGIQTCDPGDVYTCFRLPGTNKHAAVFCA